MIQKIPKKNISLMLLNDDEIISLRDGVRETKNQDIDESIKVGDICVEQKPPIDGETLPKRYYKILGIIHKLHDIDINSFLVKEIYKLPNDEWSNVQIDGKSKTRFSLSRSDCSFLNVEYQEGIEVYPFPTTDEVFRKYIKESNGKENYNSANIDYDNLGTYPTSSIDGYIRRIVLQVNNIYPINNDYLLVNGTKIVPTKRFCSTLRIYINSTITSFDGVSAGFIKGAPIKYRFISKTKKNLDFNVADENGNVYLELDTFIRSNKTPDSIVGISTDAVEGLKANDLFELFFNDSVETISKERADKIFQSLMTNHYRYIDSNLQRKYIYIFDAVKGNRERYH